MMKKHRLIPLLCAAVLVLCAAPFAAAAGGMMGDVDLNGKVDAADARILLRTAAKLDVLGEDRAIFADVTSDNAINAEDARLILRAGAKLEPENALTDYTSFRFVINGGDLGTVEMAKHNGSYFIKAPFNGRTLGFISKANGDFILIDYETSTYGILTKDQQNALGLTAENDSLLDINSMLKESNLDIEIPKLTSLYEYEWENTTSPGGDPIINVTVPKDDNAVMTFGYSSSDFRPFSIASSDSGDNATVYIRNFTADGSSYVAPPAGFMYAGQAEGGLEEDSFITIMFTLQGVINI